MRSALAYIFLVLLANLTATFLIPLPLPGVGTLQIALGTLVFGLTFTQRDRLHHLGRAWVYRSIAAAATLNLLVMWVFTSFAAPGLATATAQPGWEFWHQGLVWQAETTWRVLGASFLAILLAEAADTEVFHALRRRRWVVRVLGSNAVSVPLDTLVFNLVAFAGVLDNDVLLGLMLGDILVKYLVGAIYAWRRPPASATSTTATPSAVSSV